MANAQAYESMKKALIAGNGGLLSSEIQDELKGGNTPLEIINQALNPALAEVGDLFDDGRLYLPELILAAEAMDAAMEVLLPVIKKRGEVSESMGRVVLATVKNDVHDIGKNIVGALLNANGFEVIDLGRDVDAQRIVETAQKEKADIIGLSALLSTTLPYCKDTVRLLEDKGIRDQYHVFIGGGPVTPEYAETLGCEYGGAHASAAVSKFKKIMGKA